MTQATIGYHASHEQIPPSQLLRDLKLAESVGFRAAMCSDHFMPWSQRQGQSGFAFAWLGSALASTALSLGSVCAPGQRYHPAVVAQASATLAEMYPGRYWMALGSGQQMNEHITGDAWPSAPQRRERLAQSAQVIRRLHTGEWVSAWAGDTEVRDAFLYTRPKNPVPLYAACISTASAQRAAAWADGMITVNQPGGAHHEVVQAYRDAGGSGPVMLQVHLSWAPSGKEAEEIAHDQWRSNVFGPPLDQDLPTPEHFDAASAGVSLSMVLDAVWTSSSPRAHAEWIAEAAQTFDAVYLHHVGQDQRLWLETAGEHVLPEVISA